MSPLQSLRSFAKTVSNSLTLKVSKGLDIESNRVFIFPRSGMHVYDGEFRLEPISKSRGWRDVITVFLEPLTQHWDGKIIAVIVSGYDGDGAAALCGIGDQGGVTIAQKPDTAFSPDMPVSAIETGCIDFVLSPEEITIKIQEITQLNSRNALTSR